MARRSGDDAQPKLTNKQRAFDGGIVYCANGDWGNVKMADWL